MVTNTTCKGMYTIQPVKVCTRLQQKSAKLAKNIHQFMYISRYQKNKLVTVTVDLITI